MNWRSTYELAHLCLMLVARSALLTLTLICFLLIGIGFDSVVKWALGWLGAPEFTKSVLSQITLAYVWVVAISGALTSMVVVCYLTFVELRSLSKDDIDGQDKGEDDAE